MNYQNNIVYQNQPNNNLPMAFHNFYKWFLVVVGAFSLIPFIMSFGSDYATAISSSTLLSAAFNIATGICLMKMMKAGKIMQTILNVMNIISGAFEIIVSILFLCGGGLLASAIGDSAGSIAGGLFAVIGIIFLITGVATIVINACILKYYGKRKHLFV